MLTKFPDHQIFEEPACDHHQDKSNGTDQQGPGDHVVFPGRKPVVVIVIEFNNVRRHGHHGKDRHECGNRNKYTCEAVLFFRKKTFLGKEVGVQHTDSKTNINNDRRNNALPANTAHAVKLSGESSIGNMV